MNNPNEPDNSSQPQSASQSGNLSAANRNASDLENPPPAVTDTSVTTPLPTSNAPQFPTAVISPDTVIAEKKKKFSLFNLLIMLAVITALAIWGGVIFLYVQNNKIKNETKAPVAPIVSNTPSPSPTPEFSPDQVQIQNGSVIWEKPDGEIKTLIDKSEYKSTGITGFAKVTVSPDDNFLCVESWPPAPDPSLYVSDINGNNVQKVNSNRSGCLWSSDSQQIAYVSSSAPNAQSDIFIYGIQSSEESNLTLNGVADDIVRKYKLVGFNADGTKLICEYTQIPDNGEGTKNCEINLEDGSLELISL